MRPPFSETPTGAYTRMTSPIYVAIPVYNGGRSIQNTLNNVLQQTFGDFRVIVYDDGSTDRTAEIVNTAARVDSRITMIRGARNQGRGVARNCLLEAARGGIIAWQDADDTWRPTKLADQLACYDRLPSMGFEKNRSVMISTFDRIARRRGREILTTHVPPVEFNIPYILSDSYGKCPFQLQSTLGLTSVYLDAGGFDPQLNWSEDVDIALKILLSGGRIAPHRTEQGLANYHQSLASVNGDLVFSTQNIIAEKYRLVASELGIDIDEVIKARRLNYLFDIYLANRNFAKAIYTTLSSVLDSDEQKLEIASRKLVGVFRAMLEAHRDGEPHSES